MNEAMYTLKNTNVPDRWRLITINKQEVSYMDLNHHQKEPNNIRTMLVAKGIHDK